MEESGYKILLEILFSTFDGCFFLALAPPRFKDAFAVVEDLNPEFYLLTL
jgi:hypothetical protein